MEPHRSRHAMLAVLVGMLGVVAVAAGQPGSLVVVTVQELIQRDHRLMVPAGTEVLWQDAHFERVWFPASGNNPRVERAEKGFRAVFDKPGTYRGRFTIAGGHQSADIYPLTVTVTER